ncbi:MAG: ABC transporter substrate-binding protein [Anaerolineae bacterium]|nr:ABC transporter substrate-binding protein [Anaerolineae bacterium]MDQ7035152.1 ABC transporter substrate-binding protein [Anaerolineae bacterium]
MRGFRWQLIAFVVSIVIFGMVAFFRLIDDAPQASPTQTPIPTSETPPLATSTPLPPTSIPTQQAVILETSQATNDVPTYREALVGQIQRLNPLLAPLNPVEEDITSLIFEGLVRINEYGEPVGRLAEDWIVSRDGLEYVFRLRQDVLWQDGMPFTANDVVYTMSLLSSHDFAGLREQGQFWRTVETQKLGTYLIRFRLAQPLASFPTALTIGMLPEHALRGTTASQLTSHLFNLTPIGTGAYQLEALRSSDGTTIDAVDLRIAPVYRQRGEGQGGFAIERIRFQLYDTYDAAVTALANSLVDGLAARNMNEREALTRLEGVNIYTEIEPTVGMLIYNWDEGDKRFFSDPRVRTGLQLGLNRVNPVESILLNRAVVADSPILFTSWAYDTSLQWTNPDPIRAQELFDTVLERSSASTEDSEEAPSFDFSILTLDDPLLTRLAQEIATQWSQYGINVNVEPVDDVTYQQRLLDAQFDMALVELQLRADPDVFAYWHNAQYPDGLNYGGTGDDRLSEILERARQESNGLNRVDLYRDFQQLFINRAIAIPLYYPLYTYAVSQQIDAVQLGYISQPSDRFRTIQDWQINAP